MNIFYFTIEGKNKGKASIFIKSKPREDLNMRIKKDNKSRKIVVPLESISDVELDDDEDDG